MSLSVPDTATVLHTRLVYVFARSGVPSLAPHTTVDPHHSSCVLGAARWARLPQLDRRGWPWAVVISLEMDPALHRPNVSAIGRGSPLLWLVGGAVIAPPPVFCWQFTYSPNHCSQFLRKDRVPLLFIILVVSVVWAACSPVPRRADQPGLSSVSLWETASHPSHPVSCQSVFENRPPLLNI